MNDLLIQHNFDHEVILINKQQGKHSNSLILNFTNDQAASGNFKESNKDILPTPSKNSKERGARINKVEMITAQGDEL